MRSCSTRIQRRRRFAKEKGTPAVFVAPNSLYKRKDMAFCETSQRRNFIYVGRLIQEKKPRLLLKAFERAGRNLPDGYSPYLCWRRTRTDFARSDMPHLRLQGSCGIYGSRFRSHELLKLYSSAIASVSPGYVGLSVTQSFSYGVPMVIAKEEPHSPKLRLQSRERIVFSLPVTMSMTLPR